MTNAKHNAPDPSPGPQGGSVEEQVKLTITPNYKSLLFYFEAILPEVHKNTLAHLARVVSESFEYHQQAAIKQAVREAMVKVAKAYSAMGRDDMTWGANGVPEEVLDILPASYRKSTADIPRGKQEFMDFMVTALQEKSP